MKKLFLLATIICTMALTACGNDASTTEYGTDNNVTESTVESTVEDTTEYVEDVVEDTTEETVVEDATEVVEETVEEIVENPNNDKPVEWTGYDEGQVSITYVDGTVYEGTPDKEDPDVCVYTIIDADQQYTCDNATLGLKSYGDLYTYNSNIHIDDLDESIYGINGNPNCFYHKGARESLDVHTGIDFAEDILALYFIKEIEADDAYIINGFEIRTAQDLVNVFGKPFGIYYAHCGSDDATVGDAPRLYMYMYKVNDCILNVTFTMPNNNLNDCKLTEVVLTNPEYSGTLEEVFWLSE